LASEAWRQKAWFDSRYDKLPPFFGSRAGSRELDLDAVDLPVEPACHTAADIALTR